jgi:Transglycosylase SLT domain
MRPSALAALLPFLLLPSPPARAEPVWATPAPAPSLCQGAIASAERGTQIPPKLLQAVGLVESGRRDSGTGATAPWPWTINAEGEGHFYASKAEAVAAVRALQARGVRSIDVGCLQVNLMYHPDAFASLEQAFDPQANAGYAARFLMQLRQQTGTWPAAAAAYHSQTPEIGAEYGRRVMALWQGGAGDLGRFAGITAGFGHGFASLTPSALPPLPSGRVAVMLPSGSAPMRIIPLAGTGAGGTGFGGTTGRGLDAYRAMPIRLAGRSPRG